ncbi:hypothetical protein D3C83_255270 [compost metagenome]
MKLFGMLTCSATPGAVRSTIFAVAPRVTEPEKHASTATMARPASMVSIRYPSSSSRITEDS